MNPHQTKHPLSSRQPSDSDKRRKATLRNVLALAIVLPGLVFAANTAQAVNIIQNPGFEADSGYGYFGSGTIQNPPGNWQWGSPGNGGFWVQAFASDGDNNPHSGNNFFKEWGAYQAYQTTNLFYQDNACGAGATYSCDFWQGSTDDAFGNPDRYSFAYVSFFDGSGNLLALYSAPHYDSNYVNLFYSTTNMNWFHFYVTNQNDIVSGAVTGHVSTLTAPVGAHTVRLSWGNWQSGNYDGGDFALDDVNLDQISGPLPPQITQVYPGNMLFASNYISFHVSSPTSTPINSNDVHLTVNGVVIPTANISFSGPSTNLTAIYNGVTDNSWSNVVNITATDTLGLGASPVSFVFDTIHPAFVVEFEDYDFTNSVSGGGGQYYNNPIPTSTPQANSYFDLEGALDIDYSSGNTPSASFRSLDQRSFEVTGDSARQQYLDAQVSDPNARDWDINFIGNGDWGNYTRDYPSGTYNLYARVSGNGGDLTKLSLDYISGGNVVSNVGVFTFTGLGWGVWQYAPLLDNYGNLLPITFGGKQTLRATLTPTGGLNENFFMLVPAVVGQPFFTSITPVDGQMFATNQAFSFTVTSPTTIPASSIQIILNGQDVTSDPHTTVTGGTTASASCALLQSNNQYTAIINVTNTSGAAASRTVSFDTMAIPGNFYVKMEDWDFGGGHYDTNGNGLIPYAYGGDLLPGDNGGAVTNVDYAGGDATGSPYRGPNGLHQETCSDVLLPGYVTGPPPYGWWDIGNFNSGQWANYTRNYPAGKFYIFGRLAGYDQSSTLSVVTSGVGTTNQTLNQLGQFIGNPNGWQTWKWIPLVQNGSPVVVALGGVETLRFTSSGNCNANYFMLMPVQGISISATPSAGNVVISFSTIAGANYRILASDSLSSPNWSVLTSMLGDGTVKSVSDPATGSERYYKIVSP